VIDVRRDLQFEALCATVTGHLWHWHDVPAYQTFELRPVYGRKVSDTYMRQCRHCTVLQMFDVPAA
jgi:hypothetical protein